MSEKLSGLSDIFPKN
jgi:pyruvate/2-oxoglutarate dehydrogenase complex dihydrolipoamide dehydrogenase (E3) component